MDTAKINRMIGRCTDREELSIIIQAAKKRKEKLRRDKIKAAQDAIWADAKLWQVGSFVVVTSHRVTMTIHRGFVTKRSVSPKYLTFEKGQVFKIKHVQPRAKRVWFENEEYCFAANLHNLEMVRFANYPDELTAMVAVENLKNKEEKS